MRESQNDVPWLDSYAIDPQIFRDFIPFLLQPENREYPDLCQLPGNFFLSARFYEKHLTYCTINVVFI